MQELLPLAFAGLRELLGRGKDLDEAPGVILGPVLKGLHSRRVIFAQGGLELVDQRGALFDERDLIAAQQPQLLEQRILRSQWFLAVSIHPQRVGQAPGIELIIFDAAGRFALARALRAPPSESAAWRGCLMGTGRRPLSSPPCAMIV
jgi:hypothetical protein